MEDDNTEIEKEDLQELEKIRQKQSTTKTPSPRKKRKKKKNRLSSKPVTWNPTEKEHEEIPKNNLVGMTVSKNFVIPGTEESKLYKGEIIGTYQDEFEEYKHLGKVNWYKVRYEDGDEEDYNSDELSQIINDPEKQTRKGTESGKTKENDSEDYLPSSSADESDKVQTSDIT